MKYLMQEERDEAIGEYVSPTGFYDLVKSPNTPWLGSVTCSATELAAGSWHEIKLTYTVGGSALADGAWIKATFKFYSDWALFQTSDPAAANYVSAEYIAAPLLPGQTPSTVQELSVRFDQKGHERPFQKSVIVDIVDGFLNVNDQIVLRLGDRRAGGAGTRVQSFVERDFRFRFYVDPVGTSRFAAVPGDVVLQIVPGRAERVVLVAPRLVSPERVFSVVVRAEDAWGNTVTSRPLRVEVEWKKEGKTIKTEKVVLPETGWATRVLEGLTLPDEGAYEVVARVEADSTVRHATALITVDSTAPGIYYGDLHVHSDDTVGTNDSLYNFSYAKECAGLDVVGYTANDFNITKENWDATVALIDELDESGRFTIYPGTEWCGNTGVGGDHNVVFLTSTHREFPFDKHGNVARSFKWNETMRSGDVPQPGTWPLDELYATYAHSPESHLLIPHIGGRRANLGWHHPRLERLVEIGSAWGHFEWFYRDAISRGYRLGVCSNSDEHRGRCGGGVPGTAVFGTRGGLTGILSHSLARAPIAKALRARHTFSTTGQRLVGLSHLVEDPSVVQGDEATVSKTGPLKVAYRFLGQEAGWETVEAFDGEKRVFLRDLHAEAGFSKSHIRISWGGSRVKDRYREAIWKGIVKIKNGVVRSVKRISEDDTHPEEPHWTSGKGEVSYRSSTSGDRDGLVLDVEWTGSEGEVSVEGTIEGYVKVGNPLQPYPFHSSPTFSLSTSQSALYASSSPLRKPLGGTDLFVSIDRISVPGTLKSDVSGVVELEKKVGKHGDLPVWFVGTQADGAKAYVSAIWTKFE